MSSFTSRSQTEPRILSVAELTALIKETLHESFAGVWVSGEICDISRPQSGHVYFTLKDAQAQIRAVMWRSVASLLRFELDDGLNVVCCGEVDVYPPRGTYQLIVRQLEPRGLGAMQLALRQLQQKLAREGLFDVQHKKRLPQFPRRIGFVTSPTGAAVRDFLEVLRRRWRGLEVLIIPSRVQGEGAAEEIVRGIQIANRLHPPLDLLVVGRGGGSIEDLWCFNEERVVRAIFASHLPVVSAIGHEIDVTLSDLVADVRALTPTEAAERIVPSEEEMLLTLGGLRKRLATSLRARAAQGRGRLAALAQHRVLRRPWEQVRQWMEHVDELGQRGARAVRARQAQCAERLSRMAAHLESLSPLGVLGRGYTLTTRSEDGKLVRNANMLNPGERITTRYDRGTSVSRVEEILSAEEEFCDQE